MRHEVYLVVTRLYAHRVKSAQLGIRQPTYPSSNIGSVTSLTLLVEIESACSAPLSR